MEGQYIDAEILLLRARILRELVLADRVHLELNSLGSTEARTRYREALVAYLEPHREQLDPDSQRRLGTNPLRILDSKVRDRKSTRLNSSHVAISYAVFCLKKKNRRSNTRQ